MTVPRKTHPECPIERCIAAISGRWKAMIIWRLLLNQSLRYSELSKQIPDITERVLSQVIKELEKDGLIERSQEKNWQLTTLGEALKPSLDAMFAWGELAQERN